jgi:hypothetical protein
MARVPVRRRALAATLVASALAACAGDAKRPLHLEYDLFDPSACRRTEAAAAVPAYGDASHVASLIALLDDEDPAVRLTAGGSLKRATGHDTGYRASDPPEERRRHQAAWRAWWGERGGTRGALLGGGAPPEAPAAASVPSASREGPARVGPARGAIPPPPGYTGRPPHAGRP